MKSAAFYTKTDGTARLVWRPGRSRIFHGQKFHYHSSIVVCVRLQRFQQFSSMQSTDCNTTTFAGPFSSIDYPHVYVDYSCMWQAYVYLLLHICVCVCIYVLDLYSMHFLQACLLPNISLNKICFYKYTSLQTVFMYSSKISLVSIVVTLDFRYNLEHCIQSKEQNCFFKYSVFRPFIFPLIFELLSYPWPRQSAKAIL